MEQFLAAHALLSTSFRLRRLPSKLQHKLLPIIAQLVDDAELKWFRSDPSANAGVVAVRDALVKEKVLFPGIDYKLAKRQAIADSRFLTFTYKLDFYRRLEELPKKLYQLTNLHCLEIRCTGVRKMPMHFGKLKNLQVLDVFYAGKGSEFSIRQIGGHNLHGGLTIKDLQNMEDPSDALAVDLINKTRIEWLVLEWKCIHFLDDLSQEKEVLENVLENLQPSKHLKNLSIRNYGGTQLPSWLSNNSLLNLVSLRLKDCEYCICLPSLGLLPSLKKLWISRFDGTVSIGDEYYGSGTSPFPSLEQLYFEDMKEWEEWECTSAFPRLQYLRIEKCSKLKKLSEKLLDVKNLFISDCKRVTISRPSFEALSLETVEQTVTDTSLEEFWTYSCANNMNIPMRLCYGFLVALKINYSCDLLTTFPLDFFPNLCSLQLHSCDNLQMISQERTHSHLKMMEIRGCPQLESLPKQHILLPSLSVLRISYCLNLSEHLVHSNEHNMEPSSLEILEIDCSCETLTTFPLDLFPKLCSLELERCCNLRMISQEHTHSHLKQVNIKTCHQFESFPSEGLSAPKLERFRIQGLVNLKSLPKHMHILLPSLTYLYIDNVDGAECFREDDFLPLSLTYLEISNVPNLKKLEYKGLCHHSSLRELRLYFCPKLECLPEEGLPNSISTLYIYKCPLLKQRCQKPEGQNWAKIAHIQNLSIIE